MLQDPILANWPMPISTERLKIRPMQPYDGKIVFEAIEESRELFEKWFPWAPHVHIADDSEKTARQFYTKFILREECHLLAFSQDQLVAGCSLHAMNWQNLSAEIGYWCRISAQRKGFVKELINAVTNYAFATMGLKRISILMREDNISSRKVAEGAGFELEVQGKGIAAQSPKEINQMGFRYVKIA